MPKLLLFFLLFSSLFAKTLTVASYNVENLFDMHHDGSEYPEYIPYRHHWIPAILNRKLTNISEVICEIDADIIGLQEIENLNALKLLQQSLKKYGCSYGYRAITHKAKSAIQVGLLSKIPIQYARDIVVSRSRGIRNILETKFTIEGNPLYIFVNHWNSKHSSNRKRLRSALALKQRLTSLSARSEYIILGDFNLHYNESIMIETMQTVREEDISEKSHYNLWYELPIYQRWSHNFYGKKQALDAILIPQSLVDGRGVDYQNNSFKVFKRSYLFHKKGYILRWQYQKKRHKGVGYSDHLPILASFATKPYWHEVYHPALSILKKLKNQKINLPVLIKNIEVLSIKNRKAIIKDSSGKIAIYGVDQPLDVGCCYDIMVYKRQLYKGVYEIIDFTIEKRYDNSKKRS
jgi:endonuclease/exonuclease/phosphatase family metal-dependent hydrolase